jgi:hypothetical protein
MIFESGGHMAMTISKPIKGLLLGVGVVALALFAYSSGYGVGKDIAVRERTAGANVP